MRSTRMRSSSGRLGGVFSEMSGGEPISFGVERQFVRSAQKAFSVQIDVQFRPMDRKRMNDEIGPLGRGGALERGIELQGHAHATPIAQMEAQPCRAYLNGFDFWRIH